MSDDLTTHQAMDWLAERGITAVPSTVMRWCQRRLLAASRISGPTGTEWRIPRAALEAALAAGAIPPKRGRKLHEIPSAAALIRRKYPRR